MFNTKFGIEIEFTGITRTQAANVAKEFLSGRLYGEGDHYDTKKITAPDGRVWKIMSDASIECRRKAGREKLDANRDYSVELVSPILTYDDVETLQELVRQLRHAGGFANSSCGIHIHLDGADHTPRSIRNFVNIVASKNDLLYKALQVAPARMTYCKKMDAALVEKMYRRKPATMRQIEEIWYEGYNNQSRSQHYHNSRYHFLNLHSFFTGNHTVELRGFNSELHAGKIRSYIVLALALNHQALTQKSASARKIQAENEKFAMRTYLNRIGFIGDEFKNCREHLCKHLDGNAAWRFFRAA
jgi:hypothetical protein